MAGIVFSAPQPSPGPQIMTRPHIDVGFPIVMSTGRQALTNAGEPVTFDHERLQPREKQAYWLDEVRFLIRSPTPDGVVINSHRQADALGWLVRTKINIGARPLTNNFVPLWAMCRTVYRYYTATINSLNAEGDGTYWFYKMFRWKFNTPVFVESGTPLTVVASRISLPAGYGIRTLAVGVDVSAVGRIASSTARPGRRAYPFATAFAPSTTAASWESNELSLGNSLPTGLIGQRLIGRVLDVEYKAAAISEWLYHDDFSERTISAYIRDHARNEISQPDTMWEHVFEPQTGVLPLGGLKLEPNDAFFVKIIPSATTLIPMIGLVGERYE